MNRYKCHKEVDAVQITAAEYCKGAGPMGGWLFTYEDGSQDLIRQEDARLARWVPEKGDYKVDYLNGYVSFSPRAVFEDGYARKVPYAEQRGVAMADGYSVTEAPAPAPHPQLAPSSLGGNCALCAGDEQ